MTDFKEQIALEHYKFLLLKIQHLDESLYKNIGFSTKFITAIISFIISIILLEKAEKVSLDVLSYTIELASFLTMFICTVFTLITVAIIFSWRDYRNEEIALMQKMSVDIGRKPPTFKNILRWTETWFLIALNSIFILAYNVDTLLSGLIKTS
jgi:hypothetical protein